jgi:two-component system sensor histidine kinase RegB
VDIVQITAVLWLTGRALNPFTVLYLSVVAVAALTLPPRAYWPLCALAVGAFAALLFNDPAMTAHASHLGPAFTLHLQGMWVAFALTAAMIAFFVGRLARTLREREEALGAWSERANRFASLATLAAGTAHELNTPLGTIAVAAAEIAATTSGEAQAHAEQVREQVKRCKAIITHMLAPAESEALAACDVDALVSEVARDFRLARPQAKVTLDLRLQAPRAVPQRALRSALLTVLDNACDAGGDIVVDTQADATGTRINVSDTGSGILPEHRAHLGEPFFTTKAPGAGSGLGLYVARVQLERAGGRVSFAFTPRTQVTLWLP